MFYRTLTGWQSADLDPAVSCQLNVAASSSSPATSISSTLVPAATQPPVTIVSVAGASADDVAPAIPAADIGLQTPQINELVPNPEGTGTDETDEFIELYNPNAVPFYRLGFTLQTGTATKHNYMFPDGTILPPQSFTAFYSADTDSTLSNSSGQAALVDPLGNTISQSDPYGTAKDALAWAFGEGTWTWTTQPTPNAANVIKQVAAAKSSKSSTQKATSTTKTSAVKGASTTKSGSAAAPATAPAAEEKPAAPPIHRYVLAAVAVMGVGYGIYEYRHDLGNRLHQLRANRAARRSARAALAGR